MADFHPEDLKSRGGRVKRLARVAFLAAALVSSGQFAAAKYVPPRFYDLAGLSDAVVLGEINRVDSEIFTLHVDETLAGSVLGTDLRVVRFKNWTCSHRWKPYAVGQREIAFLYELPADDVRKTGARYGLRSGGDEGEWEIRGDRISVQGFRVPGGAVEDEGEHPGQWLPLADVLDALRSYRQCFAVSPDPSGSFWRHEVRVLCDEAALDDLRNRSVVHEYLVSTSLEASRK